MRAKPVAERVGHRRTIREGSLEGFGPRLVPDFARARAVEELRGEIALFVGALDGHDRPAGTNDALVYSPEMNTILTHDLILAVLRGEITGQQNTKVWLDANHTALPVIFGQLGGSNH